MATQTIKTTYALDVDTVRSLADLARRWNVSRSEALRRAIRASAGPPSPSAATESLRALDRLQRGLRLDAAGGERWASDSRRERKAASRRSEKRVR